MPVAIGLAALLGLLVGSWLTTVVERLPRIMDHDWEAQCRESRGEAMPEGDTRPSLWRPACRCPACLAPITGWRRLPVLGWLLLRGRCADCGQRIAWRYPALELLTAVGFAACVWRFGPGVQAGAAMVLVAALLALAWIDVETGMLPDIITLPLLWIGLLVNVTNLFAPTAHAVLGAAAGYGVLWLLFHGHRLLTGREGMGYGDFKLLAALGGWLGLAAMPLLLLTASLAGALVGLLLIATRRMRRDQPQPFGPYLALAGIVALFCGAASGWPF